MSKVHDVDAKVIQRTQQWLAGQQQPDGSWKPDTAFINEGATNRYNSDVLRITAYIAWSLENTGYHGPAVEKARQFIEKHSEREGGRLHAGGARQFRRGLRQGSRVYSPQPCSCCSTRAPKKTNRPGGAPMKPASMPPAPAPAVETTGLAVQALLKWGEARGTARKALTYIASKKDASGAWGTTQATIMALRALLLSTEKGRPTCAARWRFRSTARRWSG